MDTSNRNQHEPLKGLKAAEFQHPWDTIAINHLKKIPGAETIFRKYIKYGIIKFKQVENTGSNIKISPDQLPKVYELLRNAVEILECQEPALYLNMEVQPNAYTIGVEEPFIMINSGLVELMDDRELEWVIAHEVGHVKCLHSLYTSIALYLEPIASIIGTMTLGLGNLFTKGFEIALLDWERKSELSADRAAHLVLRDEEVAMKVMMKLAGGSRFISELNTRAFLDQAKSYDQLDLNLLGKFYKFYSIFKLDHPFPLVRARELSNWCSSDQYHKIIQREIQASPTPGVKDLSNKKICHLCGTANNTNAKKCSFCNSKFF